MHKDLNRKGFTLVETAIVLVVIGLVIMTVLPALEVARLSNQRQLTQTNLRSLMLATASYVQANGCLPCPTPVALVNKYQATLGLVGTTKACGTCANPDGIAPYASLGIAPSVAHDGWGHWITMHVDSALTAPANTQNNDKIKNFCAQTGAPLSVQFKDLLIVPTAPVNAAVVFIAHGAKGFGSYIVGTLSNPPRLPFPSPVTCSNAGGFAECNANGTSTFVDSPARFNDADPYDDLLAYADRNALVSQFGTTACTTTYP